MTHASTVAPRGADRPPIARPELVERWLWAVVGLVAFLVLVGGFTRLSRAGLSIVEWNVVGGVLPPLDEAAWNEAFAAYRASPEGRLVNAELSMAGFRRIFLIEWGHRLLARLAGLFVVVPLALFLARGVIPWRRSAPYLAIAALFGFQGLLGWLMVASGLVDRPSVSHLRLMAHFLAALALLALALWTALELGREGRGRDPGDPPAALRAARPLAASLLALVLIQVAYGALVAGLKAGWISNTWPLMFGRLVPGGLLAPIEPAWRNLIDAPATVHFVHRWLAFAVLAVAVAAWWRLRHLGERHVGRGRAAARVATALAALTGFQVALGIVTVLTRVALPVALAHQLAGVGVFALAVALVHALWRR